MKYLLVLCSIFSFAACRTPQAPAMSPQFPSPMVDYTRAHQRVNIDSVPRAGNMVALSEEWQGKLYVPAKWQNEPRIDLLVHFHGDSRVAQYAVDQQTRPWALFHCQWGNGSSAYRRPVEALGAVAFLDSVSGAIRQALPAAEIGGIYLSGWSAGYGAIRSMISEAQAAGRIDGILLLDGLHCSYVPAGKVMAEGGALDSAQMQAFAQWARRSARGEKSFLFTHSAVFPGTYASTTETAEYLLQTLGIRRQPRLAEGPVGMQQTSVAGQGKLQILSFAGNSAPDHIDHYHGLAAFLGLLGQVSDLPNPEGLIPSKN